VLWGELLQPYDSYAVPSADIYSGSMPTDGTLFLENLPYSKQYLLTLLSVFFSLGAVLSSTVSYIFLPGASCREFEGCDIAGKANDGWRKVLLVLGLFVGLFSAIARLC
jgi:MFS family permease